MVIVLLHFLDFSGITIKHKNFYARLGLKHFTQYSGGKKMSLKNSCIYISFQILAVSKKKKTCFLNRGKKERKEEEKRLSMAGLKRLLEWLD